MRPTRRHLAGILLAFAIALVLGQSAPSPALAIDDGLTYEATLVGMCSPYAAPPNECGTVRITYQ